MVRLALFCGAEEEGANLSIQLHHAFPMYLGGAAKQELVALPAALHIFPLLRLPTMRLA
jgi:hypothetical protein